jgi:hypothetical protein
MSLSLLIVALKAQPVLLAHQEVQQAQLVLQALKVKALL